MGYEFEFDIVVSNPPYIPQSDMQTLASDVLLFEDTAALCGGIDGMDIIRDIVMRLPEWCNGAKLFSSPVSKKVYENDTSISSRCPCWMEVDTSHPDLINDWLNFPKSSSQQQQ